MKLIQTVEELKRWRPDLYREFFEEGHAAGVAEGYKDGLEKTRERLAEEIARWKIGVLKEVERLRGLEIAARFENQVARLREQGLSLAAAIGRVAASDCAAHDDYLDRAQRGQAGLLK